MEATNGVLSAESNDERQLMFEKVVVRNLLNRLFTEGVSQSLCQSFYPDKMSGPQFSSEMGADDNMPIVMKQEDPDAAIWCRFDVQNFATTHYAKDPFPPFSISMRQLNGDPLPRMVDNGKQRPMADTRVQVSIHNKWADVSNEVLPDTEFVRVLKDGQLTIRDFIFQDVSLKHGGYFIMHITPIDFSGELLAWKSPKFQIQSVKTHCVKKRKLAAANKMQQQALSSAGDVAATTPSFNPSPLSQLNIQQQQQQQAADFLPATTFNPHMAAAQQLASNSAASQHKLDAQQQPQVGQHPPGGTFDGGGPRMGVGVQPPPQQQQQQVPQQQGIQPGVPYQMTPQMAMGQAPQAGDTGMLGGIQHHPAHPGQYARPEAQASAGARPDMFAFNDPAASVTTNTNIHASQ